MVDSMDDKVMVSGQINFQMNDRNILPSLDREYHLRFILHIIGISFIVTTGYDLIFFFNVNFILHVYTIH